MRYINRIVIPQTAVLLEEYFTVYPHLPKDMGDAHGGFMVRVEMPRRGAEHTFLVTFESGPENRPGETAYALDLYDIHEPPEPMRVDAVESHVRTAHENVETALEGSLTDRLRSLFEPEGEA